MTNRPLDDASRRRFLHDSGVALGAAWLSLQWSTVAAAAQHAHEMNAAPAKRLAFLSAEEARDVEAIAAQIVPGGTTPGAAEAGVVYFIDHLHAGLRQADAEPFRAGLAQFAREFAERRPGVGRFADLPDAEQLDYLRGIEATPFFENLRVLTLLGLLSLPSYGGNRDGVGWKLVGFDDRHVWEPPFGHYDRDYPGFAAGGRPADVPKP